MRLWIAVIGIALLMAGSAVADPAMTNAQFMRKAVEMNLAEVALGKLSQVKSRNAAVRAFGQTMVTDHTGAERRATALAARLEITIPKKPTAKDRAAYNKLSKLGTRKFDRAYAKAMVADHERAIILFTGAAKGSDDTALFAREMLPQLQRHLEQAKAIIAAK